MIFGYIQPGGISLFRLPIIILYVAVYYNIIEYFEMDTFIL